MTRQNQTKAKILVLDLETAPAEAYVWGLRDVNIGIEQVKHDQHVLMWAAKWVGEPEVHWDALPNHKSAYRDNRRCDRQIALSLRKIMDEAVIIVTQNGNHFDLKWANQLFLKHGIEKPSNFYSVDLLKESKSVYYSISHKLDFRGRQLALGSKKPHEGFKLWLKCLAGEKAAWNRMIDYCRQDVRLTESYYLKLRPRMKNHPNINQFREPTSPHLACVVCSSMRLVLGGFNYNKSGKRQRMNCLDCKHRMSFGRTERFHSLLKSD